MFTWICPKCGREVPPAYDECPDCAAKQQQAGTAPAGQPAAETAAPVAPVPPTAPAPRPAPAVRLPARPRSGLPTWLLSIIFALAFIALGAGTYWGVKYMKGRGNAPQQAAGIPLEDPATAGAAKASPLQKYIEVTGVRFIQEEKSKVTEARFLVVNHSPDDILNLGGTVKIWGRTQKAGDESVGTFSFNVPSLGPWQSREFSAPVDTRLRVYELPDWQNVVAQVTITSP